MSDQGPLITSLLRQLARRFVTAWDGAQEHFWLTLLATLPAARLSQQEDIGALMQRCIAEASKLGHTSRSTSAVQRRFLSAAPAFRGARCVVPFETPQCRPRHSTPPPACWVAAGASLALCFCYLKSTTRHHLP